MLRKIETPSVIKSMIAAPIPEYVIQERDAGRGTTLSYLSGATVIDILNATFGHLGWSSEIVCQWMQECSPFFNAYAKVPDDQKVTHPNGKKGIWEEQAPVAFVKVRLTVYLQNEDGTLFSIVKEAFGSKAVIGKQNEQDATFKAAQTDALKKAASLLGIGLQLYRGEEEAAYNGVIEKPILWNDKTIIENEIGNHIFNLAKEQGWNEKEINYFVEQVTEGQYNNIYALPEAWFETLLVAITPEEDAV